MIGQTDHGRQLDVGLIHIRTGVHHAVPLGSHKFTVLITGQTGIVIGRGTLAGEVHELLITHGQGTGTIQILYGSSYDRIAAGIHRRAETAARGVGNHADLFRIQADAAGNITAHLIGGLGLTLDSHVALRIPVCLYGVRLNGHVGLVLSVEAAFHRTVSIIDHFRSILIAVEHGNGQHLVGRTLKDLHGAGSHGLQRSHVGGQDLQVLFHLFGGSPGLLAGFRTHDSHHIAAAVDLFAVDNGHVISIALRAGVVYGIGHHIGALHIFGSQHLDNAGHRLCLRSINADNVRMSDLRLDDRQLNGTLWHLLDQIVAVIEHAAGLGHSGGPGHAGTVDVLALVFVDDIFHRSLTAHDFGCHHDSVNDLLVSSAAADVAVLVKPLSNLFPGGRKILRKQRVRGYDKTGTAETALDGAAGDERLLDGMQMLRRTDPLDRGDGGVLGYRLHLPGTGTGELPV